MADESAIAALQSEASALLRKLQLNTFLALPHGEQEESLVMCDHLLFSKDIELRVKRQLLGFLQAIVLDGRSHVEIKQAINWITEKWETPQL
jgi:hypothetical protein